MNFHFTLHRIGMAVSLFVCVCLFLTGNISAQENDQTGTRVSIGFNGNVRLGKWAPVFIETDLDVSRYEVAVLDGDDSPVVYSGELLPTAGRSSLYQAWARIGRKYGTVNVRLLNKEDEVLSQSSVMMKSDTSSSAGESAGISVAVKSTRGLILTFEPTMHFKEVIGSSFAHLQKNAPLVLALDNEDELPNNWLGYDGVETIMMVTSDLERVKKISVEKVEAIKSWVQNGGSLVLSVGKNGAELIGEGGLLADFCPGKFDGLGEFKNSKRLETFTSSDRQLIAELGEPIPISKISQADEQGKVLVYAEDKLPLVVKKGMGKGQVVFVAFDIGSERLVNWESGRTLVKILLNSGVAEEQSANLQSNKGSSVSTFGYEDIVGQLRVPLDQYSKVNFVAFTWIALLIGLYILCIGPGDFFFLKKLLGKMELTWLTFPLLSLLFCGLAIGISRMTRPSSIQLNQLEIIDVDSIDGKTRGTVWANLYSPESGSCNVSLPPGNELGFELDSGVLSWHGLPGTGLGGMWSSPTPGLAKTPYVQVVDLSADQNVNSSVQDLPLQVSSSKPMFAQWSSDSKISVRSKLRSIKGRLNGTVKNPFPFPLKNCQLVYENWSYVLLDTLDGESAFDVQTETEDKALSSLLTRKVKKSKEDNRSNNTAWDPTDTRISRIANIMMFYQTAGGKNYTGLTHGYQSSSDISNSLYLNRAVLVGEIDKIGTELLVDGESTADKYDRTHTLVRIFLPVKIEK